MTSETPRATPRTRRDGGTSVLVGAGLGTVLAGLLATLLGAVVGGSPAAYGALVGTALVVLVFAGGSFAVNEVARILPAASLLVALITYGLQLVVLAAVFTGFARSGALGGSLHAEWLAAGVVGGTLAWVAAQTWLSTRARIPLYDLPAADPSDREEAGAR